MGSSVSVWRSSEYHPSQLKARNDLTRLHHRIPSLMDEPGVKCKSKRFAALLTRYPFYLPALNAVLLLHTGSGKTDFECIAWSPSSHLEPHFTLYNMIPSLVLTLLLSGSTVEAFAPTLVTTKVSEPNHIHLI